MSKTAKIVRFHKTGPADVLQLDELPLPEPGAGEVRLRIKAIGLDRAEVMYRNGAYFEDTVLPSKIGYEASGTIEAVGKDVDPHLVGKTVSTVPGAFGMNDHGVCGEVAVVPLHGVAEYPSRLSYEEGTSIWMQYLTAYGALVWLGKLAKGDFVLVTAASSSMGLAAIQIVKAEGGVSIAVTRTAAKKAELLKLGADHVIVADVEDLAARVNEITSRKGARLVLDSVAGKILEPLCAAAATKGIIFEYGTLATEPTHYPSFAVLGKQLTIRGYAVAELIADEHFSTARQYVFDHLATGEFKPFIDKTFPLAEIGKAYEYMESNAHIGKIVVTL